MVTDGTPTSNSSHSRHPFYASVTPQTYVIGATTVIAWMLVLMLFITPRSFSVGRSNRSAGFLTARRLIEGGSASVSFSRVGSRPPLQKIAALTVGISLLIATAGTFRVAQRQYDVGYIDAIALREEINDTLEIKITRVLSNVFVWLAQVQTLIRLFPRHKEKVVIKWTGLLLILLDTVFSLLNAFLTRSIGRPRRFVDPISALNYLFSLALSLLYAAWVIYYSLTKRRYAFYHPFMKNICLVAFLSVIAILTPVVFFVVDISNPNIAGWGDYFRWVGAAAASVVVWEWVERIEALEREEKKDGILGREVFDGDEMLDVTPSEEVNWPSDRYKRPPNGGADSGGGYSTGARNYHHHSFGGVAYRLGRSREHPDSHISLDNARFPMKDGLFGDSNQVTLSGAASQTQILTIPPMAITPTVRADATIQNSPYTCQYRPISDETQLGVNHAFGNGPHDGQPSTGSAQQLGNSDSGTVTGTVYSLPVPNSSAADGETPKHINKTHLRWLAIADSFKRSRNSPPPEVRSATVSDAISPVIGERPEQPVANSLKKDAWSKLGDIAAHQGEWLRERARRRHMKSELPVIVVPARPGGSGWTSRPLEVDSSRGFQTEGRTDDTSILVADRLQNGHTVDLGRPQDMQLRSSPVSVTASVEAEHFSLDDSNTANLNGFSTTGQRPNDHSTIDGAGPHTRLPTS